jgi:putative endonuclease
VISAAITIIDMNYFVYLMASQKNGTLYAGVTNNLIRRVFEHKNHLLESFTKQYSVHTLVWFEATDSINAAIQREKQLKNWRRAWKVALIEKDNPEWRDLYDSLL